MIGSNNINKLLEDMEKQLEKHGVTNAIIAVKDPDSDYELFRAKGSIYWQLGFAEHLVIDCKRRANNQQCIEDEDN